MSKQQHTPGPWKATGNGHKHTTDPDDDMMEWNANVTGYAPYTDNEYGDFEKHDSQSVASGHGRTFEEAKANARLIAAAPDMLSALKLITEGLTETGETTACNNEGYIDALDAIDKATVVLR